MSNIFSSSCESCAPTSRPTGLLTVGLAWFAGFSEEPLRACCGGGGPYNYNPEAACGSPGATVCGDPSAYVHWDGIHLTEAAYKYIANGWLNGLYAYPSILDLAN